MTLTNAQYQDIANDVDAKVAANFGSFVDWRNTNNFEAMAAWYNSASALWVWKPSVDQADVFSLDGFTWSEVDGLTAGKRAEWEWLFSTGTYNPNRANQRAAIVDVWSGTAAKNAVQAAILAFSKRPSTNFEAFYLTTNGAGAGANGTQALPENLTFVGDITDSDIAFAVANF